MDEKNSILSSAPCPPVEELSLYLDEPSDDLIAAHVAACEKCQAILAAYDQIDRIQRERSVAPDDLSERIQKLCRQQRALTKPLIRYPGAASWLRLAAGLAVLASAAGILSYIAGHGTHKPNSALASHPLAPAMLNEPLSKIEQVLPGEVFSLTDQMRLQGNIDTDSLQSVSTAPKINTASAGRRKYRIGNQVEHIWMVDDLENGKQMLHELAASTDCPLTWQKHESANSPLKAVLSGTDKSIQSLVNTLKDKDWVLLSPAWPQPHAENSALLTGNQIQYQATLVKKE